MREREVGGREKGGRKKDGRKVGSRGDEAIWRSSDGRVGKLEEG